MHANANQAPEARTRLQQEFRRGRGYRSTPRFVVAVRAPDALPLDLDEEGIVRVRGGADW